eukprot:SM000079S22496  [mRNA]  locus=s79:542908:547001:+ [translate_table: standard]
MAELMRHAGLIVRQPAILGLPISVLHRIPKPGLSKLAACCRMSLGCLGWAIAQHKWSWPFEKPVDVEGLRLRDYNVVIKRPMDLGTIQQRMERLGSEGGYHTPQEIANDVRLVFSNAMTYNHEGTDVHVMARTLAKKFDERWRDERRAIEDFEARSTEQAADLASEEVAYDQLSDNIVKQPLTHADLIVAITVPHGFAPGKAVERENLLQNPKAWISLEPFRLMTVEEKRQLGHNLGKLPSQNLNHVIQIIAQKNPRFNASAEEVEVDIDAQEPATLWRLHQYVLSVLTREQDQSQTSGAPPAMEGGGHHPFQKANEIDALVELAQSDVIGATVLVHNQPSAMAREATQGRQRIGD